MNSSNGKISYVLMHKDREVLFFDFYGNTKIIDEKFMPYGLYIEKASDIDTRTNNLLNIYNWLARRVITIDRKYSKEIYNYLNLAQNSDDRTKALFSITYHSLSLTDVYWVKNEREKTKFKSLNLYDNSLSNSFVDIFLRGKGLTINKDNFDSKDLSTSGQCPKAWYRTKDNDIELYKDGSNTEVLNEVLASKIISYFKVDAVKYKLGKYDGKNISKCKIITSKEYSIVNAFDIKIHCINQDIDFYKYILKLDGYNYYMMNIIDYLVGNVDRHPNNWGFLIDNKTNQPIRLYPLMDFNKSFKDYNTISGNKCLTTDVTMNQLEAALVAVSNVGLNIKSKIPTSIFANNKSKSKMFCRRLAMLM